MPAAISRPARAAGEMSLTMVIEFEVTLGRSALCDVGHRGSRGYPPAVPKRRLDSLLADRGLYESRSRAAAAVMAGDVTVAGRPARKPGELVAEDTELAVAEAPSA